jgi:hypothetical protein
MFMASTAWGVGQVLYDILWFFLFFFEVWLVITVVIDIFRRDDMKGWKKALWLVVVLVIPLIGVLLYLIIYGDKMRVHAIQESQEEERAFRDYVRRVAGSSSPAEELSRLAELRDRGVIDEDEFRHLKERVLRHAA